MILEKLFVLREILMGRIDQLDMWSSVGIYFHGDKFPQGTILEYYDDSGQIPEGEMPEPEDGEFMILWYNKKRSDNPHPCRWKIVPLTIDALNGLIKRQREKLRSESKNM